VETSASLIRTNEYWRIFAVGTVVVVVAALLLFELDANPTLLAVMPPAISLLAVAIVSRQKQGSWLAPGAFFALAWSGFVWLPLLVAGELAVSPWAVWWIVGSAAAVSLGAQFGISAGTRADRNRAQRGGPRNFRAPAPEALIVLCTIIGAVAVLLLLRTKGLGFSVFLSSDSLNQIERDFSVDRYLNGVVEPLSERLLRTSIYFAALLAGLVLATRRVGLRWLIAFLPLVPAAGFVAVLTTKTSLLYTVVLIASSYLAFRLALAKPGEQVVTRSGRLLTVAVLAAFVPLFVFIQVGRYGYSPGNPSQVDEVLSILRLHAVGHLAAFSDWFAHGGWASPNLTFGTQTFAGVFDATGLKARPAGVYAENVYLAPGVYSNVYTMFRGLIEDFTAVGALTILLIGGFAAGLAFARVQQRRIGSVPVLAAFFAITLWSFVVNLFIYNTVLAAWLLFAAYVFIAQRRGRARTASLAKL
jgi:oligosaccharide repeat unit polymerase